MALAPLDTHTKMPSAVRAAADRANAHFTPPAEETPTPAEAAAPIEEETSNVPPVDAEPPLQAAQPEGEDSWEHKYKSMKGRYDRAQQQIDGLTARTTDLQAALERAMAQLEVLQAPPAANGERLLTPDEENDYGADFLSVVGKKAKEELNPELAALRAQVANLSAQLQSVTGAAVRTGREQMLQTMDEQVPNWKELNQDEEFLGWLALREPYSGAIRQELLTAAFEKNDVSRVTAFFKGFLAEKAAVAPANREQALSAPNTGSGKVSLQDLAAPGRAKSAAAANGAPAEKPIITGAQIAKFYADSAAGKYAGREAERDAYEKQIFSAQAEGRVR